MVTASHNDNGWTGVKMGARRPVTFGPGGNGPAARNRDRRQIPVSADGGAYRFVENFPARYIADLTEPARISRKLKVVAACGNGTAGAFAPKILSRARLRGRPARLRARLSTFRATIPIPKT